MQYSFLLSQGTEVKLVTEYVSFFKLNLKCNVYFSVHHQVEIEVPQTCSFVLHTTECILSEVSVINAQGQPVYRQAAGAEAFQVAMEKYVEQPVIFWIFLLLNRENTTSSFIFVQYHISLNNAV